MNATGFLTKSVQIEGETYVYSVYVPLGYDPARAWPLILFLHGVGERGRDGLLQTDVGIAHAIRKYPDRFPCIVVIPQCPETCWWNKAFALVDATLARTREAYNVDADRLYLTGLSMGGFGTWAYAGAHPDLFAALVPICGGGKPEDAARLAHLPIWAFHGDADSTVSPKMSRRMVEAVRAAGGDARYTEYPGVGHNSWDAAYGDPELLNWLLEQRRR